MIGKKYCLSCIQFRRYPADGWKKVYNKRGKLAHELCPACVSARKKDQSMQRSMACASSRQNTPFVGHMKP